MTNYNTFIKKYEHLLKRYSIYTDLGALCQQQLRFFEQGNPLKGVAKQQYEQTLAKIIDCDAVLFETKTTLCNQAKELCIKDFDVYEVLLQYRYITYTPPQLMFHIH